jgi:hypothetical protein
MNWTLPALLFVAAIAFAASPLVSGGFGGFDPGRFPVPQVDPPVQPAGWAFSIWGPIYAWLLLATGFGLFRRREARDWADHRPALLASLAVGAIWIPVAKASPLWATILIIAMLAGAVLAFLRAPARDRWLCAAPIGLYAGWLTAASAVSAGTLAAGHGLVPALFAAYLALAGAVVAGALILRRRREWLYALGIGWALFGIAMANGVASPLGLVALAAAFGLALASRRGAPS